MFCRDERDKPLQDEEEVRLAQIYSNIKTDAEMPELNVTQEVLKKWYLAHHVSLRFRIKGQLFNYHNLLSLIGYSPGMWKS